MKRSLSVHEAFMKRSFDAIVKQLPDEFEVQLDNEDEDDILIQLGELDWEKHVLEEELEEEDDEVPLE